MRKDTDAKSNSQLDRFVISLQSDSIINLQLSGRQNILVDIQSFL